MNKNRKVAYLALPRLAVQRWIASFRYLNSICELADIIHIYHRHRNKFIAMREIFSHMPLI